MNLMSKPALDHQRCIADELQELVHHRRKERLVSQKRVGKAMHPLGLNGHIAFRVQIEAQLVASGEMVEEFDQTDFHDPVTIRRFKARRFGIKDDFTH